MDEHPLAITADRDGDGFHRGTALRRAIAGANVDVTTEVQREEQQTTTDLQVTATVTTTPKGGVR